MKAIIKKLFDIALKNGRNLLIAINIIGIILITANNAYYSYGVMIYNVSFKEANDDFWSSELLFVGIYLLFVNIIGLLCFLDKKHKKNK